MSFRNDRVKITMAVFVAAVQFSLGARPAHAGPSVASYLIAERHAEEKAKSTAIPVIGVSADKKYHVYKLQGDYSDVKYFAGGHAYTSADLFGRMAYIQKEDVNANGYKCGFICKDRLENVVGINPNFAFLAPKK